MSDPTPGTQIQVCGGLNGKGPHWLIHLSSLSPVGCLRRIRRCSLVGVGVALWEKVCYCEWALSF